MQLNNGSPFPAGRMRGSLCNRRPYFLLSRNTRSPLQVYICTEGNPSITIDLSHDDRADGSHKEMRGGGGGRWGRGDRAA